MFVHNLTENKIPDSAFNNDYMVDDVDYSDISDASISVADELFSFLQQMIAYGDNDLMMEKFTSDKNALIHFKKHCLAGIPDRYSDRSSVLYDFSSLDEYLNREDILDAYSKDIADKCIIHNLLDTSNVITVLHQLFSGKTTIKFDVSCGLTSSTGRISLVLHAWATDVTTNYPLNTIDFIIRTPDQKTITMYPIDANYLESKLNNIFTRNGFAEIRYNR